MIPVVLRGARLVLDQPGAADVDVITSYCQDPLFERYLTTPWPYLREHAEGFVLTHVPAGWESDSEYTWAIRVDGEFAGVIALRTERADVGFWLGTRHRGHGYMTEALRAACGFGFDELGLDVIRWECLVSNLASAATARSVGFEYTGEASAEVPARDGSTPPAWHGILHPSSSRTPQPGWPLP